MVQTYERKCGTIMALNKESRLSVADQADLSGTRVDLADRVEQMWIK